jgi:hypothetical protein
MMRKEEAQKIRIPDSLIAGYNIGWRNKRSHSCEVNRP